MSQKSETMHLVLTDQLKSFNQGQLIASGELRQRLSDAGLDVILSNNKSMFAVCPEGFQKAVNFIYSHRGHESAQLALDDLIKVISSYTEMKRGYEKYIDDLYRD